MKNNRVKPKGTFSSASKNSLLALATAAAALPIMPNALAEAAPEKASFSYKYLDYQDSQPDADRIRVKAHAASLTVPWDSVWSFTGTVVNDVVSGASPRYHASSLTKMHDKRDAGSVSVTRYFPNSTYTFGASYSDESDYRSRGVSFQGTLLSEDKNTTWTYGVGYTYDNIHAFTMESPDTKKVVDLIGGITQILTPTDIAQLTFRASQGHGYYSDPYKFLDKRPRDRDSYSALAKWNHHFKESNSTLRTSYRYYTDSYDIKAHTFGVEYVKNLPDGWTITPQVRFHDQSAASFYYEVDPNAPFPQFPGLPVAAMQSAKYATADQRLSSFGALTLGMKISKQITRDLAVDAKYEKYEQRGSWSVFNSGSNGLPPFRADMFQLGLTYTFN